ncbi:MAG TPA: hypothetical protein VKQ11_00420 [Candidatus Sulfotelmatobacter sp.]|nr:hypothetical protein [Candidatus Sulfotelmatobacter sp.]
MGGFTNPLGSSPTAGPAAPLAPQPSSGDSLAAYLQSLTNRGATTGGDQTQAGGQLLQSGAGTTATGLNQFTDPINYWKAILAGDPNTTSSALAPTVANVNAQYDAANKSSSQMMPRGGFASTVRANLPFQKSAQVSNSILGLQPQAASALTGIANNESQIGLGQQGIGVNEQGVGLQQLQAALQALLQRRQQNVSQDISNTGLLTGGLSNLTGDILGSGPIMKSLGFPTP